MAQLNANTPYVQCYIRKEITGYDKHLHGYIFGVKSMLNYPMLFHFQSEIGAIFWNMPISAFFHTENFDILHLFPFKTPISNFILRDLFLYKTLCCCEDNLRIFHH